MPASKRIALSPAKQHVLDEYRREREELARAERADRDRRAAGEDCLDEWDLGVPLDRLFAGA